MKSLIEKLIIGILTVCGMVTIFVGVAACESNGMTITRSVLTCCSGLVMILVAFLVGYVFYLEKDNSDLVEENTELTEENMRLLDKISHPVFDIPASEYDFEVFK